MSQRLAWPRGPDNVVSPVHRNMGRPDLDAEPVTGVSIRAAVGAPIETGPFRVDGKFLARGNQRFRIRGVTYGPFAPNAEEEPFPPAARVRSDFAGMRAIGVNSIRTYHVPPEWFLNLADEEGMAVLVDVPWPKHLCFLDSQELQDEARQRIRQACERGRGHSCILAYSIGNEIPTDIIRWHGARRVERFLEELCAIARETDPDRLLTFSNYPSAEYLDLSFLDFATFNVYLHDLEAFRCYLFRLQNLVGDKPLLLGEIGMDTLRQGEKEQSEFLESHLRETFMVGLAGAFVFSWTDDWHTGGHQIEDWAFGITRADRSPKAAGHAVRRVYKPALSTFIQEEPKVSVVVCSYNGARMLEQCLRSLLAQDYPDYEIILVDDGSTDDTLQIAAQYPEVRTIHQENAGLSAARNVGLQSATGQIVAYTDSDCYADPDWLTLMVCQLQSTGAAGVGGPNLTPDDGWLTACVGASPGQPTHVLENDQAAEHIPGCNMAYRREALEAINGFNPHYKKAGDDVDLCWRLETAGMWITFAPGAFVWHHRRNNPGAYLRQQAGYGEAEKLLYFDHPDRFNALGEGKWRGSMYGASLQGIRFGRPVIYHGTYGTGLFQTIYQPGVAHWANLPGTLEWVLASGIVAAAGLFWLPALGISAVMVALTLAVAMVRAAQASLPARHEGFKARLLIAGLCLAQPLVRSWWRHRTQFFPGDIYPDEPATARPLSGLLLKGRFAVDYWDEQWRERTEFLDKAVESLSSRRWPMKLDSGWCEWDLEIRCHPWTTLRVCTAQEDHGSGKRLFRVRYWLQPAGYSRMLALSAIATSALAISFHNLMNGIAALVVVALYVAAWRKGASLASELVAVFDGVGEEMGLVRCGKSTDARLTEDSQLISKVLHSPIDHG